MSYENIYDRIKTEMNDFFKQTGIFPNYIILGTEEIKDLKRYDMNNCSQKENNSRFVRAGTISEYNGIRVFTSQVNHCIDVGYHTSYENK